jgi:hypothetical protein
VGFGEELVEAGVGNGVDVEAVVGVGTEVGAGVAEGVGLGANVAEILVAPSMFLIVKELAEPTEVPLTKMETR